jgi:hypothetical protein
MEGGVAKKKELVDYGVSDGLSFLFFHDPIHHDDTETIFFGGALLASLYGDLLTSRSP